MGQLISYVRFAAEEGKYKPLMYHIGTQIALGGLKGTILVAEATAIISLINSMTDNNIPTPTQLMEKWGWIPDVLVRGFPTTVLGYDISSSSSSASIPAMFSMPAFTLGKTAIEDVGNFIYKYFDGTATNKDKLDAWKAVTPTLAHTMLESIYTNDAGFQTDASGKGIYKRSPEEDVVGGLLGVRSSQSSGLAKHLFSGDIAKHFIPPNKTSPGTDVRGESQTRELASSAKQLLILDMKKRNEVMQAIVDHVQNHQRIPDDLFRRYLEIGGSPSRLGGDIAKHIKNSSMSGLERLFSGTGKMTPNKLNQYERLKESQGIDSRRDNSDPSAPPKNDSEGWVDLPLKGSSLESETRAVAGRKTESKWLRKLPSYGSINSSKGYEYKNPPLRDSMPRATEDPKTGIPWGRDKKGYPRGETRM